MKKIEQFAEAIKEHEGWFEGSRSMRNANPGNLRYRYQRGSIGADKDNFAIFESEEAGMDALIHQIEISCSGQSKVYSPDDSLYEFFKKWAPSSDGNRPYTYARFCAQKLGISPFTCISELLKDEKVEDNNDPA